MLRQAAQSMPGPVPEADLEASDSLQGRAASGPGRGPWRPQKGISGGGDRSAEAWPAPVWLRCVLGGGSG